MGRPSKPTELKIVQGNPGKRPLNENEPKPAQDEGKAPSYLTPKAKAAWRELAVVLGDMRVLTVADRKALEMLCDTYAEWRELRAVIEEHGHTYETFTAQGDKMIRPRPEVTMAADAWKRASAMLTQFGLTPSSRSKVSAGEKQEESDPLADFLNRKKK